MASLKTQTAIAALLSKGFLPAPTKKGSHHRYYYLYVNNKKTIVHTYFSHGERDFGDHVVSARSKQLKLRKSEFLDLVNCPMSGEQYLKILRERKILSI